MTYREPGASPPCHRCERPSQGDCPACRRPTCARHLATGEMCTRCDEELYRYLRAPETGASIFAPLGLVLATVALALIAAFTVPALAPVALIGTLAAFPVYTIVRKRRRRARFFRLMRERGELPAEPEPVSDVEEALTAYLRARPSEPREARVDAAAPSGRPDD